MNKLWILLKLAELGADSEEIEVSSNKIADEVNCSQQTAARWLSKLSENGLIEQETGPQGQIIRLTPKGLDWLDSIYEKFHKALGGLREEYELTGRVTSGFGEGKYYVKQEKYQKQFKEKLDFEPYPGTLDLKLDKKSVKLKEKLQNFQGIRVKGFDTDERSFGEVRCFSAKVMGEKAAVVLPTRTHHEESVVEIISSVKIREKYELEDGDEIKVEVKV